LLIFQFVVVFPLLLFSFVVVFPVCCGFSSFVVEFCRCFSSLLWFFQFCCSVLLLFFQFVVVFPDFFYFLLFFFQFSCSGLPQYSARANNNNNNRFDHAIARSEPFRPRIAQSEDKAQPEHSRRARARRSRAVHCSGRDELASERAWDRWLAS
jgi:hypothetical protein